MIKLIIQEIIITLLDNYYQEVSKLSINTDISGV